MKENEQEKYEKKEKTKQKQPKMKTRKEITERNVKIALQARANLSCVVRGK